MALLVNPLRCRNPNAFGGKADVGRSCCPLCTDAIGPKADIEGLKIRRRNGLLALEIVRLQLDS